MSDHSISNQGNNDLEGVNASPDFVAILEGNVKSITGRVPNRRKGVSLFAGWQFVRFREGDNESFPIMPRTDFNAPVLEYCPNSFGFEQLENPTFVPFWLPMALAHFCKGLLAHELIPEDMRSEKEKNSYQGAGWDMFREELCKQTGDTIAELCRMARQSGFNETALYMTQCLYYESGLHDAIEARQQGRPVLRSA